MFWRGGVFWSKEVSNLVFYAQSTITVISGRVFWSGEFRRIWVLERGGVLGRGSALEKSGALMVWWKVVVFARAAGGCGEEGYS